MLYWNGRTPFRRERPAANPNDQWSTSESVSVTGLSQLGGEQQENNERTTNEQQPNNERSAGSAYQFTRWISDLQLPQIICITICITIKTIKRLLKSSFTTFTTLSSLALTQQSKAVRQNCFSKEADNNIHSSTNLHWLTNNSEFTFAGNPRTESRYRTGGS